MIVLKRLIPAKLRNKLFLAFFLCVFVPFLFLNYYVLNQVQTIMQDKISAQAHNELNYISQSLEDLTSTVMKTVVLLEQDPVIEEVFQDPLHYDVLERQSIIENKLKSIYNSLFLNSPQIYITLIDFHQNVYASFQPKESLNYYSLTQKEWYIDLRNASSTNYAWTTNDENYVHPDISTSPNLLTLHAKLLNKHYKPYGVARISIDYPQWFAGVITNYDFDQDYFILTESGEIVTQSNSSSLLNPALKNKIFSQKENDGYFIDKESNTMINYNYIEKLDWHLVYTVNLDRLFSEINTLKIRLFSIMLLITVFFILLTFVISHKVTQPLRRLQEKMKAFIKEDKKELLSTSQTSGEVQVLTESYNQMINHINFLINKLQIEERHKQSIKFKMLIAQMNPHFLLNTLNTVKWISIKNKNNEITEICVALGKILETSLNSQADLVPLHQEMDLVDSYVHIQKFRYQDLFDVNVVCDEEVRDVLLPKLSIQMLVENAIHHGFYQKGSPGTIQIRAFSSNDGYCQIEIEDNGIGIDEAKKLKPARKRDGIGIENIKERLSLLFGTKAEFALVPQPVGTLARLRIPITTRENG